MSRLSLTELIDRQNEIIKMENSIINELFHILLQHVDVKDLNDIVEKISIAAQKSEDLKI